LVIETQPEKLGNLFFQSDTTQVNKVSADVIPPGKLLFQDGTATPAGAFKQTATGAEFGPFRVSIIDTAPAGALKTHVAEPNSEIYMEAQGALPGHCEVQPGTRPGTIAAYVEPTVSASPTQAEVTAVRNARRRKVGEYRGKTNNNVRDGGVVPPAADTDLVIVKIY